MSYSKTALDQLESGKLKDFEASFKKALKNDSPDMLNSLAEELYSLGFSQYSKTIYQKLLKEFPKEDSLKVNLAEIAIDDDKDDQALNLLSQVKPGTEEYIRSLMVAADLYQTQEMFEISEQKLLEAKRLDPDEDAINFALAEFYFSTRNYRKSVNLYLDLIKKGQLEISSVNLVERLGVSYAEIGKFEQAVGYLEQIKTANMNSDVKFELAFTYYNLKDYQKAIKSFEDLRDSDPQYSSLYPYLADSYLNLNRTDDALRAIQESLGVDQYNEKLWLKAAQIAIRADKADLVQKYLQKGLEIAPEDLAIRTTLSDWYVKHEKYSDNIKLLKPLQEDNEFDAHLAYNLAVSYHQIGNIKSADRYFQIAAPELSDQSEFLKDAALFYREIGKFDQELSYLQKYLKIVPDDVEMAEMYDEDSQTN